LITREDLSNWKVKIEEPVMTRYEGIDVYKLTVWTQGPVLLQALNMLEQLDLQSMGYNSARYTHALYQVMNLAFADRDFYYGDPAFPPVEPVQGLLSKEYARERLKEIDWTKNNPALGPGDPYPFQGESNPFMHLLREWSNPQSGASCAAWGINSISGGKLPGRSPRFILIGNMALSGAARAPTVKITASAGEWVQLTSSGI
jgi:gamma-glutamyltranspeptidase / glutathione hydrolase